MSTNSVRNLIEALRRTRDARLFQSTSGKQFQIDLPDLQFESVVRPIQPQAVNQHRAGERLTDPRVARESWRIN